MSLRPLLVCLCAVVAVGATTFAESVRPVDLRCEYRRNPEGLDSLNPRLFWRLEAADASARGLRQHAYRILVASSPELLDQDAGDLWDTGRVTSEQTTQVVYQGQALSSGQECFWKVRVWDQDGQPSTWSQPAKWSMGLLDPKRWQAEWIGLDVPLEAADVLAKAKWIWYPEGSPATAAPVGTRYFRRSFEMPTNAGDLGAELYIAADNRFRLSVNGHELKTGGGFALAARVDLSNRLVPGLNVIAVAVDNEGETPNPAGLLAVVRLRAAGSPTRTISTDNAWRVSDRPVANWNRPDFDDREWVAASELGPVGMAPWGQVAAAAKVYRPSPMLRTEFRVDKPVRRAVVYATALGVYRLRINGRPVGQDYLTPGWTDYRKRLHYNTYDVSQQLRPGANALGGILADGWYAGNLSILGQFRYGRNLRLRVQLEIEYEDGSRQVVATGPAWRGTLNGPIRRSDMQDGETYDARREIAGWDLPGFDDTNWSAVDIGDDYAAPIDAYPGAPIRALQEIKPVSLAEPKPGVYVFDLGQNFAGWARLRVRSDQGKKIVLRFAEMLNADGTIYTENLRSARCTDIYFAKGNGLEEWEPLFTFHGFRYVELTGLGSKPALETVTGIVAGSACPRTSSFECSNPMLNRLYQNIVWGQRSNYFEVPTDCPQRDERLGWTGDTQVFIRTGCYNQDVSAFFTKWLVDLEDSQREDGAYGNQAPELHGHGSPGWADAGIICPWTIWQVYGDTRVIEQHYDAMARWIAHMRDKSQGLLRPAIGFGDWLSLGGETPKDLIATAYFAYVTRLMAEMADAIQRGGEAEQYRKLYGEIRAAFIREYVAEDGRVKGDTQTGYLMALHFDLLPRSLRDEAAKHLIRRIQDCDWHLSTGFLGVNLLLPTLEEIGRSDIAWRLLQNTTYPSWGYSVVNGATTIWERWNSYTLEHGFGDAGMNSFNHYAYGSAGQWMFTSAAGIDLATPGFQRIRIRPQIGGGLDFVRASYRSIHGEICTHWRRGAAETSLDVTIPPNTSAEVCVPTPAGDTVLEGDEPAAQAKGVKFLRQTSRSTIYQLGSGTYRFHWPAARVSQ